MWSSDQTSTWNRWVFAWRHLVAENFRSIGEIMTEFTGTAPRSLSLFSRIGSCTLRWQMSQRFDVHKPASNEDFNLNFDQIFSPRITIQAARLRTQFWNESNVRYPNLPPHLGILVRSGATAAPILNWSHGCVIRGS